MNNDQRKPTITANEKPGGYIEPGTEVEKRSYETPVTQEKPVPVKETKTVKKKDP